MGNAMQQHLELIDIYDVWYHPWWQQVWVKYAVIAAVVFLSFVFVRWLYIRFFRVVKVKRPFEIALEKLSAFTSRDYENPKLFYICLTDILKEYFQELYGKPFVGTTDDEMVFLLEKMSIVPKGITDNVKTILTGVTFVKFANQKAVHEQMIKALTLAIRIVEETSLETKP